MKIIIIFLANMIPIIVFSLSILFLSKQVTPTRVESPSTRIIGGDEVVPHSIPYQVFLNLTDDSTTWECSGSLITTNYVLTAARCCSGATSVNVILGAHNISEPETNQVELMSKNLTIHENFNMNVDAFVYENDIALILLPESVTLNEVIQVVKLPSISSTDETFVNQSGIISGWGLTDAYTNTSYSPVLLSQINDIISNEECSLVYYDLKEYDVCMKANITTSPCLGDYGSPLTVEGIQVGIASQNVMFCIPGYPFLYTRVSSFIDWLKQNSDYEDN